MACYRVNPTSGGSKKIALALTNGKDLWAAHGEAVGHVSPKGPLMGYGWWGYRAPAMRGLTLGAWSYRLIDAVHVWLACA